MYKRILVAVGDHPEMDTPVAYAIALAAQTEAELWLLRGLTVPFVASAPDMVASSTLAIEHVLQANEPILASAMAAAEQAGVSYQAEYRWGALPDLMLQTAEEIDSDLLVVGAPTCPGWRQPFGGYVARKLLRYTQRPLLIATTPPPVVYGAPLWPRLLVVHDGSAEAESAVHYATQLAGMEGLELCEVHTEALGHAPWHRHSEVSDNAYAAPPPRRRSDTMLAASHCTVTIPRYEAGLLQEVATTMQCEAIILKASHAGGWYRFRHTKVVNTLLATSDLPVLLIPGGPGPWV